MTVTIQLACKIQRSSHSGQAISEFITTVAFLAPFLIMMASFSNLLNLNTETLEAGRLAAWERTVYKPSVGYGVNTDFIQNRVSDNVNRVYLNKPYTDYGPVRQQTVPGVLPSIVDRDVNGGQPVSVRLPSSVVADSGLANADTRLAKRIAAPLGGAQMISAEISIAIDKDYSLIKAISPNHYRDMGYRDRNEVPTDPVSDRRQFHVASHAALIAEGWMPAGDAQFSAVTSSAAFDNGDVCLGCEVVDAIYEKELESLSIFEEGNALFDAASFQEVELLLHQNDGGYITSSRAQSLVLPSDL